MKIYKRNIFLLNLLLLLFVVCGCRVGGWPESNPPQVASRFSEPTSRNPTVLESAMELSEKYAKLSNETVALKQKNKELTDENQQLNDKLSSVEAELLQTQKELTEANELLIDMRVELNNWKINILGFRQEMREADTEELKALFKILTILGGEDKNTSNEVKNTSNEVNVEGQDS